MEFDYLKEQLLSLAEALEEEDGMDFSETHALFKWTYPERPHLQFQLMILELEEADDTREGTIH